ncbi:hypothetical protein Lal_00046198 [Lupinus albus]|nr:hypothetical protein Lal_00046198 [Lupinus albus]
MVSLHSVGCGPKSLWRWHGTLGGLNGRSIGMRRRCDWVHMGSGKSPGLNCSDAALVTRNL